MRADDDFRSLRNRIRDEDLALKDQSNLFHNSISLYFGANFLELWYQGGLYVKIHDIPNALSGNILRLKANVPPLTRHAEIKGDDVTDIAYKDIPSKDEDDEDAREAVRQLPVVAFDAETHFAKLADAVIFLHSHGIVHRDLAFRNLLLSHDEQDLILCDLESRYGSSHCPEIALARDNGVPEQKWPYSEKSDVYYFGVTIAEFVLQNGPRTPWQYSENFVPPPPFDQIFHACLRSNPDDRPSMLEVKGMLESVGISDAVIFLHSRRIVHRDLAFRNLLLSHDEQDLILCDLESRYGSSHCPEIALARDNGVPEQKWPYSEKSDVYYFGVTIAEFVLQNGPRTPWQYSENFVPPPPFDQIFHACLRSNPDDRPSMLEVKGMLESVGISGNSGLKVSRIILGTMQYGDPRWVPWLIGDEDVAISHIKAAYDAGIQTFDTANVCLLTHFEFIRLNEEQVYSNGQSEVILGKAIKKLNLPREEIVVITKVHATVARDSGTNFFSNGLNPDEHGYVNQHGLSRKHIFDSIKHSLERLQLDYVDLLMCHRFDKETPIAETMQALHDIVKAGYVRYIGMSSCWAWQFQAMQNYAITNKLTPFIAMQDHYNLVYREEEREMLPTLKHFGVGAIPYASLARGLLARPPNTNDKTTRGGIDPTVQWYNNAGGTKEIIKRVEEVANKRGITMGQVSIAWLLSKNGVTAPVVGTTSLEKLEDIIGGTKVILTPEEIKYLEEPYRTQAVIGHT
ncbi:Versiconal hemiacetal acetate reductase [Leucoagaricus sp. SymC.cos]|nr:Versiconal hemiacetal acetate reductase [Leucoagaricus sp. SymC.cos]